MTKLPQLRADIYYWKCDRPSAFHGVLRETRDEAEVIRALDTLLVEAFPGNREISPAGGKGNHRTYFLKHLSQTYFLRVEDGPECDTHLAVESQVLAQVAQAKLPVPQVFFTDATRQKVPFAVQVLEYFPVPDLNRAYQDGQLSLPAVAEEIGRAIATWQNVPVAGFGPFQPGPALQRGLLQGYHERYETYFRLRLADHLTQLKKAGFLSEGESLGISRLIEEHASLLALQNSCLVHKDLALWNILGAPGGILAFIDWDDAMPLYNVTTIFTISLRARR